MVSEEEDMPQEVSDGEIPASLLLTFTGSGVDVYTCFINEAFVRQKALRNVLRYL